jgi:hypothetical protein
MCATILEFFRGQLSTRNAPVLPSSFQLTIHSIKEVYYESDKEIYFQSEKGLKIMKPEPEFFELTNLSQ